LVLEFPVPLMKKGFDFEPAKSEIKSAKAEIKKRVISPLSKKYVKIKRAKLGDLSGAVGAALLVKS